MATCANILKPSDFGGSLSCAQLEVTLNELEVICGEVNALNDGSLYFNDESPGNSPVGPLAPATVPGTLTDATRVIEFYDDYTNYWSYTTGGGWVLEFQRFVAGSAGAPNSTSLVDNASISIQWWGTLPPTFVEDIVGTYTVTVPSGTRLKSMTFFGGTGTLDSNQLILNFVDVDGKSLHFSDPYLLNNAGWQRVDLGLTGINPTQDPSVVGTVTSTWINMTYVNFRIFFNFAA